MTLADSHLAPPPLYDDYHGYPSNTDQMDTNNMVDATLGTFSSPQSSYDRRLPYPVVIPQRRPGSKERGWVNAYAPALEQYGINQEMLSDFISSLNKAIQVSRWLVPVQVAALSAGFVPNTIAMGVTVAVQAAASMAAKTETKWKLNSFLDRYNEEVLRPRGLYCLIVAYNPVPLTKGERSNNVEPVLQTVPRHTTNSSFVGKAKKNLRNPFSITAEGQHNLPPMIAPLIFPENSQEPQPPSNKLDKIKRRLDRINKYLDRRAQARYAAESQRDILTIPHETHFKNRYLDPNHPATNGGLLGLISGGYLTSDPQKGKQREMAALEEQAKAVHEQHEVELAQLQERLRNMRASPETRQKYIQDLEQSYQQQLDQISLQREYIGKGKRRITKDVLYLMIVDMPSKGELAIAREQLHTLPSRR
ncbi:hypothetical protein BBP40_002753 [Aspergillus hancockii]|nr:hypothetical protein BBP40_002753 [Aspergillus hancockii]